MLYSILESYEGLIKIFTTSDFLPGDGSEMARRRSTKINHVGKPNPKKIQTLDTYISLIFSSERRIWLFCLVFRVLNSLLIRTYFDPDEHWQSLEVAHRVAFGYLLCCIDFYWVLILMTLFFAIGMVT